MKIAITPRQIIYHSNNCLITVNTDKFEKDELADITTRLLDALNLPENENTDLIVKSILFPEIGKTVEQNTKVEDAFTYLVEETKKEDNFLYEFHFNKETNQYYVVGINRALPATLGVKISESIKKGKETGDLTEAISLINFWKWVARNPDEQGIEDLLQWIDTEKIPILPSGLLLTFRRVWKVEGKNYQMVENISELYLSQRRKKKSTDVSVWENNGVYSLHEQGEYVGNLKDLYHSLNNSENTKDLYYTDNHTKTQKYYVGVEVRMDRNEVDSDKSNVCSTGLTV